MHVLAKNWWALALRGVAAIVFGIITFIIPGVSLLTLVFLFGAYALVDGIFNIVASFRAIEHHWAMLIEGIIGVLAGIVTFAWPGVTAIALLYLIAFWAIFTGVFEIVAGIRLRKFITNEWVYIVMGVTSLLFGALILFAPVAGALAIVIWIGAFAFIFGVLMLVVAFRLRSHSHHIIGGTPQPRTA